MLFQHRFIEKIKSGIKTETRRLELLGEHFRTFPPIPTTVCYPNGRIKWQVGRTYAVQDKRGGYAVMRIKITDITLLPLYPITSETAIAEGFDSPTEFYDYCRNLWGVDVATYHEVINVWVIKFEYINGSYEAEQAIARIRSAGKLVKHFQGLMK